MMIVNRGRERGERMSDPVKVGIVGLGRWARVLTRAAARSPHIKIAACFSRTEDKRVAFTHEIRRSRA
jgi:predicted dehydrogenase